jgi:hypothetical protein
LKNMDYLKNPQRAPEYRQVRSSLHNILPWTNQRILISTFVNRTSDLATLPLANYVCTWACIVCYITKFKADQCWYIYAQNRKQVELLAVQWHLGLLAMILLFPEQPRMTGYVKHWTAGSGYDLVVLQSGDFTVCT